MFKYICIAHSVGLATIVLVIDSDVILFCDSLMKIMYMHWTQCQPEPGFHY